MRSYMLGDVTNQCYTHAMARKSSVLTKRDRVGDYEVEIFDSEDPKGVMVCVHGRGVHRWDGEQFFYNVADYYPDYAFLLVEQNQFDGDICLLSPLPVSVSRVQGLISLAAEKYPGTPIFVLGHSMGCGVTARLDLDAVKKVIFVAPAAGAETRKLTERYGDDVAKGKLTVSVDGLKKYMSKEFVDSVYGIDWEDEYRKLLARFAEVYVFEAGEEEIVGKERLRLRSLPFAGYDILPGARHNLLGKPLKDFFVRLSSLI